MLPATACLMAPARASTSSSLATKPRTPAAKASFEIESAMSVLRMMMASSGFSSWRVFARVRPSSRGIWTSRRTAWTGSVSVEWIRSSASWPS